jgi:hypothetical protein
MSRIAMAHIIHLGVIFLPQIEIIVRRLSGGVSSPENSPTKISSSPQLQQELQT